MADLYLAITDGTTTCTIADGAGGATSYRLKWGSWAPKVAARRRAALAGRGPYEDVVEDLTLNIHGSSLADAYSKLQTLAGLLEQAEQFERGEAIAPVLLKYSPPGATVSSAANPLQAMIYGGSISMPGEFNAAQPAAVIASVRLKVQRQGEWIHTTESAASSATTSGEIATISLGAAAKSLSPTKITITNVHTYDFNSDTLVAVASAANRLILVNAEGMSAGVGYSSVADSTHFARNTNILRYTPASTDVSGSDVAAISPDSSSRAFVILANMRNNSATTDFKLYANVSADGMLAGTPSILVPAGETDPRWYVLGQVAMPEAATGVQLMITASAASGTLDIDTILVMAIDQAESGLLLLLTSEALGGVRDTLTIDPQRLTGTAPRAICGDYALGYRGDLFVPTKSATIYVLVLQTGGDNFSDRWRATTGLAGEALETQVITLARARALISPE